MKKSGSFSGSLGFVLAAAGSAVGVGNIWRFPYLCAKDGGGLFLLVYLVLVLTFGFTLLTTDVAIGRRAGRVLHLVHHLPRLAHRLHADLFGADGVGRVLRRGKGH